MIVKHFIGFHSGKVQWKELEASFRRIGLERLADSGEDTFLHNYDVTLEETDPRLTRLKSYLAENGLTWLERIEHHYAHKELLEFPLLSLGLNTAPKGLTGPYYGTEYDLAAACPICAAGALQIGPLYLKESEVLKKGKAFQTMDGELLISPEIADVLREQDFSGLELRQAYSTKMNPLAWWQLIAPVVLPRWSEKTSGIIYDRHSPPCFKCGRDGHYNSNKMPMELVYDAKKIDLEQLPDAMTTWECFGKSGISKDKPKNSRVAHGNLIVSPKVYELLHSLKIRGLTATPVRVE